MIKKKNDATLEERTYFALVDPVTGRRAVIAASAAGTAVWYCKMVTSLRVGEKLILGFFFQAEDGIRDFHVTGVQTCALPIFWTRAGWSAPAPTSSCWRATRPTR